MYVYIYIYIYLYIYIYIGTQIYVRTTSGRTNSEQSPERMCETQHFEIRNFEFGMLKF